MDEQKLKMIAGQLRQPNGEFAIQVGENMNKGNLQINLNTFEALNLAKGDNVLEIGMGNGYFVKNIVSIDNSIKYTGCDFSQVMVEEARKHNENYIAHGQAEFFNVDASKLPFEPATFDKAFSINTIYFWDNPASVLSEIRRVLKPGGRVTISVRPKSIMEHYSFTKYGFTMFSKEDLEALLSGNYFKVVDIVEKAEPEMVLNGESIKAATLLITGEKQ